MDLTGVGTLVLAVVTALAIIVNSRAWYIDRAERRRREATDAAAAEQAKQESQITALRQLYAVVEFFMLRMETLKNTAMTDATGLAHGCDVCLLAALSDSVTRSLPPGLAKPVYDALFESYGVLAKAIYRRPELERQNQPAFRDIYASAATAYDDLRKAATVVDSELLRLLP